MAERPYARDSYYGKIHTSQSTRRNTHTMNNYEQQHHHPTTTFMLSDAIERIHELEGRLQHASFIPAEELLGLCVAGSLMISALAEGTETTSFSEEEIELVENVSDITEALLLEMYEGDDSSLFNNPMNDDDDEEQPA
jgi:hypothetical protein